MLFIGLETRALLCTLRCVFHNYFMWLEPTNFFCWFFFFLLFKVAPMAYGSSQTAPQPQQLRIQTESVSYTTAHGNAGSLTHWVRPGIEPATSWFLVRFTNPWATMGTPPLTFLYIMCLLSLYIINHREPRDHLNDQNNVILENRVIDFACIFILLCSICIRG